MRAILAAVILALGLSLAFASEAAAPAPKKPIQFERMMGRWYEVARTPNPRQKGCFAAFADWARGADGKVTVVNTCRKGSPAGAVQTFRASARLIDAAKAKIGMTFFGVVSQEYWILDHGDAYEWSIMATPGGNYVWIFSRQKALPAAQKAALIARVKALGYDTGKLEVAGG